MGYRAEDFRRRWASLTTKVTKITKMSFVSFVVPIRLPRRCVVRNEEDAHQQEGRNVSTIHHHVRGALGSGGGRWRAGKDSHGWRCGDVSLEGHHRQRDELTGPHDARGGGESRRPRQHA